MKTITFISVVDMAAVDTPSNVISVTDPKGHRAFACTHKNLLCLEFEDLEYESTASDIMFDVGHARRIIDFVKKVDGDDIIVHCFAGKSRSAAIAKFISETFSYTLNLNKPCIGTTSYYNSHVYTTLRRLSLG